VLFSNVMVLVGGGSSSTLRTVAGSVGCVCSSSGMMLCGWAGAVWFCIIIGAVGAIGLSLTMLVRVSVIVCSSFV